MQRQRYRFYRRTNGTYYAHENDTGKQLSLGTKDRSEAAGLLAAKNQAAIQPILNVAMAKVYLSAKSPTSFGARTLVSTGLTEMACTRTRRSLLKGAGLREVHVEQDCIRTCMAISFSRRRL
jgi:hypothetical protein